MMCKIILNKDDFPLPLILKSWLFMSYKDSRDTLNFFAFVCKSWFRCNKISIILISKTLGDKAFIFEKYSNQMWHGPTKQIKKNHRWDIHTERFLHVTTIHLFFLSYSLLGLTREIKRRAVHKYLPIATQEAKQPGMLTIGPSNCKHGLIREKNGTY